VSDGEGDNRAGRDRRADEDALLALSVGYAATADARDGAAFADLFCADGALVVPRYPDDLAPVITRSGREALATVPDGLRRFERTFHQVTNASFTVDGDRATGDVQCVAHHLLEPEAGTGPATGRSWIDHVWFIRYRDGYARTTAGWRFARRVLHLQWVEERAVERVGAPWPAPADVEPA
jgi:hypothetical protein